MDEPLRVTIRTGFDLQTPVAFEVVRDVPPQEVARHLDIDVDHYLLDVELWADRCGFTTGLKVDREQRVVWQVGHNQPPAPRYERVHPTVDSDRADAELNVIARDRIHRQLRRGRP